MAADYGSGEFRGSSQTVKQRVRTGWNNEQRELVCSKHAEGLLFEGDIIVVTQDLVAMGVAIKDVGKRWANKTLIYKIDGALPNQARVTDAIAHWQQKTSIKFKVRTNEADYVLFRAGSGCSSAVGKVGGVQFVTLGDGCSRGNAIHEIGHALGLWHEQSRADRDTKVKIMFDNIQAGAVHNFDQHIADGTDLGSYDYGSIMHYPRNAFAKDPTKPTIVTPNGEPIGQRDGLSAGDVQAVAAMYP